MVLEIAAVVALGVCIFGGKQRRVNGWPMAASFVLLPALVQLLAVGIVAWEGENEERFAVGWKVGKSWILAVTSLAIQTGISLILWGSRYILEEEGGYELIPDLPRR